jgi:nicotinamidase/pyrazinamidase
MKSLSDILGGKLRLSDTIFWDVDTQIDFLNSKGKLYVPGSESIMDTLSELTRFGAKHARLLGSVDAHTPRSREFRDWPEHCVYGTLGQRKTPESTHAKPLYIPQTKLSRSQLSETCEFGGQVIFEKDRNDVRANLNVAPFLALLDPEAIAIYGVVTEICVDLAVNYLSRVLGYRCLVVVDSIKEINEAKARRSLADWEEMGVELVKTADIIGGKRLAGG